MTKMGDRQISRGHAEQFDAIVWANDVARGTWNRARGDTAEGAIFVEEAIERSSRGDGAAGLLWMEKRGGSWRFGAAGADGERADSAQTALCAECHRDAPRDFVFPVGATPPMTKEPPAAPR
jgi:hypothetical protein